MERILTKVVHSESKSAWNVVGVNMGTKHKVARCPYVKCDNEILLMHFKSEALEHAEFISDAFNKHYESGKK